MRSQCQDECKGILQAFHSRVQCEINSKYRCGGMVGGLCRDGFGAGSVGIGKTFLFRLYCMDPRRSTKLSQLSIWPWKRSWD